MNAITKLAIAAALIAAIGGSFLIPGPSESEVEQSMSDWKDDLIQMAEKDRAELRAAGAFTK